MRRAVSIALLGFSLALPVASAESSSELTTAAASPRGTALEGTEPPAAQPHPPARDLQELGEWLGDAGIVGLGERVHGTHTLHRLAHRIFAYLAQERGFTVFALEVDQTHAKLLDDYVQGVRDDLDGLLAGRWWAQRRFYDRALADLLRWMREYNKNASRTIHFAGFDSKQPLLAAEVLLESLGTTSAEDAARLEALLDRALAPGGFGIFPNVWGFTGSLEVALESRSEPTVLRVATRIRGSDVTLGTVGVSIEGSTLDLRRYRAVPLAELDAAEADATLEVELPSGPHKLELSLFHRGNGTVEFEEPRITRGGTELESPRGFPSLSVRPLMLPLLQSMDYRYDVLSSPDGRAAWLRVAADPVLDESLQAARRAEDLVHEVLDRHRKELTPIRQAWLRQHARLITQALEWRVIAEPNRDVFLAENLRWLSETAYPGARVLALAHTSHTERRRGKMGALLSEALGEDYRTVSMIAGSGEYLELGDVASLRPDTPLERRSIAPAAASSLEAALAALSDTGFWLSLVETAAPSAGRAWLESLGVEIEALPDVVVYVDAVEPIRPW